MSLLDAIDTTFNRELLEILMRPARIPTRDDLLVAAKILLSSSLRGLDTSATTCSACELRKKVNWGEAKAAAVIHGMIDKIKKLQGQDWVTHVGDKCGETPSAAEDG